MNQLPAGKGLPRLRLWDRQWRLIWDAATSTTGAYQHISTSVFGTVDYPDGRREVQEYWRCPEGIRSERLPTRRELDRLLSWPVKI